MSDWISIKEQQPIEGQIFDVWVKVMEGENKPSGCRLTNCYMLNGTIVHQDRAVTDMVTHWMPIPGVPKGEGS